MKFEYNRKKSKEIRKKQRENIAIMLEEHDKSYLPIFTRNNLNIERIVEQSYMYYENLFITK